MKKLLILLVLTVLLSSFVIAEGAGDKPEMEKAVPTLISAKGEGMPEDVGGNGSLIQEQIMDQVQTKLQDMSGDGLMLKGEAGAKLQTGLANAMTQVKNENAKVVLEQNMNKFAEQYQNRLANMEGVEVTVDEETGAAMIKAKEEVKFLGMFKTQKTKKFELSADGEIKEKKSAFGFLYSKAKTE
ncbi:hypothetical protein JXA48_04525 [Candidatus Woesearchaeota archaeon]|nr:hypothetical protein [Candidatus Woesearchaeota archaeon]